MDDSILLLYNMLSGSQKMFLQMYFKLMRFYYNKVVVVRFNQTVHQPSRKNLEEKNTNINFIEIIYTTGRKKKIKRKTNKQI